MKHWTETGPGRQLDGYVSEHIFGQRSCVCCHGVTCSRCDCLPYSTDLNAAMKVVLKVQEGPWRYILEGIGDGNHVAKFRKIVDNVPVEVEEWADTPAHAICLAALRTVEGDDY